MKTTALNVDTPSAARQAAAEKMPGHWLLAKMGKRVLRPGGLELTRQLLHALTIGDRDDVVEFAPGLGVTARMTLAQSPRSYTAIERDRDAADAVNRYLSGPNQRCIVGSAEQTHLPGAGATVVYGEAMLSMQPPGTKSRIVAEAARLLKSDGRYGIHELCLVPDDLEPATRDAIQHELTGEIHVGVRPLTVTEWRELLESSGLRIVAETTAPMHLLEPRRLVRDEGLPGAARFLWNVAWHKPARRRVLAMRRLFRKYRDHLAAIALVAVKKSERPPSPGSSGIRERERSGSTKETSMNAFQIHDTVGAIVARRPALSRVFEQEGIDYCCGGKKALDEVCREKGVDPAGLLAKLEASASALTDEPVVDAAAMSLAELADHIEETHHAYLRRELPRLDAMTEKVASVHGEKDARLAEIRRTFLTLSDELTSHMMKEEQILFPMIRRLDASKTAPAFHCGSLANPIAQMEHEHDEAGSALERLRTLTDGYTPPEWACNTYRAMLDGLAHLERDMHQHVHKENNVLFPRALVRETQFAARGPSRWL